MNPLSTFARDQLERRAAALQRALDARQIRIEDAEANLNCWLAIACAAGAQHPEFELQAIWPEGAPARPRPEDFMPRAHWTAELTRARDAAISKHLANPHNTALLNTSIGLNQLAQALGCPPISLPIRPLAPTSERNAA